MNKDITVFKIRIDSITPLFIGFEIFTGSRINDAYVNMISKGGYGVENRLKLPPNQFSDFALRLIAYVYTKKDLVSTEQIKILWGLRLNIWDHEAQQLSKSIFQNSIIRSKLYKLGLLKKKYGR